MASGQVPDEPALKLVTSARLLYIAHSNARGHDVLNHVGGMNKTPDDNHFMTILVMIPVILRCIIIKTQEC